MWADESGCAALAARWAATPALGNAFIELEGELGAGKTTLVRHVLRALGVTGPIRSPTYALVELYDTAHFPVAHFDFYRCSDPREWEDAGFREPMSQPGLKLCEWASQLAGALPAADLRVHLRATGLTQRDVILTAFSPVGVQLL